MKQHANFLCSLLVFALTLNLFAQEANTNADPNTLIFQKDSLINELRSQDKRWTAFLRGENVLTGIYHLKTGEGDMQKPHDTDEVYYIIEGKAKFSADNKETAVSAGSILFVKAEVPHRFSEIQEDLVVLVFFDQ